MSHSLFSHYIIMQQTNKDLLMQEIHCIPSCTFPPLLTCWYYRFNCKFLSEGFFAVIKTFFTHSNVLWEAIWHLHCLVIYVHAAPCHKLDDWGTILWIRTMHSIWIICHNSQKLNIWGVDRCLTLFRISVLSRSFISMLKASSFSCGPRLQEIVIQALPGRSQSW